MLFPYKADCFETARAYNWNYTKENFEDKYWIYKTSTYIQK